MLEAGPAAFSSIQPAPISSQYPFPTSNLVLATEYGFFLHQKCANHPLISLYPQHLEMTPPDHTAPNVLCTSPILQMYMQGVEA
jgi:hypothetical protein